MKWRNEYGDSSVDSMFWIGAILFLAVMVLVLVVSSGIARALTGIGT